MFKGLRRDRHFGGYSVIVASLGAPRDLALKAISATTLGTPISSKFGSQFWCYLGNFVSFHTIVCCLKYLSFLYVISRYLTLPDVIEKLSDIILRYLMLCH